MLPPEFIINTDQSSDGQLFIERDRCIGDESALTDCVIFEYKEEVVCDFEDVNAVLCSSTLLCILSIFLIFISSDPGLPEVNGAIMLSGAQPNFTMVMGLLEIYYNGSYGTVCDDGFTDLEASVACRQLNYTDGS